MQDQQMQSMQSAGGDVVRDQDKFMLVLAYLGPLALVPFLTVKDSEYVRWHSRQGLALFLVSLGIFVSSVVMGFIPVLGWLYSLVACFAQLGVLALMIFCIVKAFEPTRFRIPLVADLAEKL